MARCVWALESVEIVEHLSEMQDENSRGWLANLFETMSHVDLIWMLVTVWAIWYARRKIKVSEPCYRHSRRSQSPKMKISERLRRLELESKPWELEHV
jgi:hypothetical protein